MNEAFKRKLAAILSADVVGYSRLMADNEEETVSTLKTYRKVVESLIAKFSGRLVDNPGDNMLAEFASVVDALRCAWDIQQEIKSRNLDLSENRKMTFRIGVNLGDVIEEEGRIYGDGVNVAARLESLADAGGISISGAVYNYVENKVPFRFEDQGVQSIKNIDKPVQVYRVVMEYEASKLKPTSKRKRSLAIALGMFILVLTGAGVIVWNTYFHIPDVESLIEQKDELKPSKKPCIAVLPFDNMSGDPEQEYFSDGLTEEIITTLSKNKHLLVIARNSTFSFKGMSVKVQEIGRELGATHIVEGSVRKEGNKVRVTVQLISATTGNHIWAETYDRELKDIFILQNEISEKIAAALIMGYVESEIARARGIPTDNLTALDLMWRGLWHYYKYTKESNIKARDYCKRSIELDPKFSMAYAILGWTHIVDYWNGFTYAPENSLDNAFEMAQKSVALNETNSDGHMLLAYVYSYRNQYEQAIAAAKRSISFNPNDAREIADMANVLNNIGKPEEAVKLMEKAIQLNPNLPARHLSPLYVAYFMLGKYKEALESLKKVLILNPNYMPTYWYLSYTYLTMWNTQQSQDPQILGRWTPKTGQVVKLWVTVT